MHDLDLYVRPLEWRREKAIVMESPVSGPILRWRGRAKDVDVMLRNLTYTSGTPGSQRETK